MGDQNEPCGVEENQYRIINPTILFFSGHLAETVYYLIQRPNFYPAEI